MKNSLKKLIVLSVVPALLACSSRITEVQRISNTQKSLDAVVAIREVGATVATPTEIYVVLHGQEVKSEPVFRADNVEALNVAWIDNSRLLITADSARVFLATDSTKISSSGEEEKNVSIKMEVKDLQ